MTALKLVTEQKSILTTNPIEAQGPWSKASESYRFISTARVLDIALANGYEIQKTQVAKTLRADKQGFQKHRVDLVHRDFKGLVDGSVPRLTIINGHDSSTALTFALGLFRLVCENGLLVGDVNSGNMFKIYHTGKKELERTVYERIAASIESMPQVINTMKTLQGIQLSAEQTHAFTELVAGEIKRMTQKLDVNAESLLETRRADDVGSDAWRVFNRVQENAIKGGYRFTTQTGRIQGARAVKSIEMDVKLNKMIFEQLTQVIGLQKAA